MSAIFGLINRNGAPVEAEKLKAMQEAMAHWGPDGGAAWQEGPAGLGQLRLFAVPEAHLEHLPVSDPGSSIVFTAEGRVDNRQELLSQLDCENTIPDGDLLFAAYRRWGADAPQHIYGDYSFAAWHPEQRKLFLARDHFGNTAFYYYLDADIFAFASDRQALLALNPPQLEMDELYLAQVVSSWPAYHGERTIYTTIKRLPPAHCLTVTPDNMQIRQYWRLEDTPELHLPRREDYVAAFRELFDEAVRAQLRSGDGKVAVTLSGGLDSGSVTAVAAEYFRDAGQRLDAFTSVPLSDTNPYVGKRFGDEFPFAQATAEYAGNVDLHRIAGSTITPIQAIRKVLTISGEPGHAAGNFYWLWELQETAHAYGCTALLTGQMGNAGISWPGDIRSQTPAFQIKQKGWRFWAKEELKQGLPARWLEARRMRLGRRRLAQKKPDQGSALHPDFVRRLNLHERRLADPNQVPARSALDQRYRIIMPGRGFVGALHAQNGAAHGLEVRDPTADARILAFTISVPDRLFTDSKTGVDRWLIREAMRDRLPDSVRLNRNRGRQAGDLVPRLRASSDEVETALVEIETGPAAAYLDVPNMRRVWGMVQTEDTMEAFHKTVTVLTRGIMAGLFVNQFFGQY